jgi:hypothetical protein
LSIEVIRPRKLVAGFSLLRGTSKRRAKGAGRRTLATSRRS